MWGFLKDKVALMVSSLGIQRNLIGLYFSLALCGVGIIWELRFATCITDILNAVSLMCYSMLIVTNWFLHNKLEKLRLLHDKECARLIRVANFWFGQSKRLSIKSGIPLRQVWDGRQPSVLDNKKR